MVHFSTKEDEMWKICLSSSPFKFNVSFLWKSGDIVVDHQKVVEFRAKSFDGLRFSFQIFTWAVVVDITCAPYARLFVGSHAIL